MTFCVEGAAPRTGLSGVETLTWLSAHYGVDPIGVKDAAEQMFRDEFGAPLEYNGAVFEVMSVPDDVAEALPPADGITLLLGEQHADLREAARTVLSLFGAEAD